MRVLIVDGSARIRARLAQRVAWAVADAPVAIDEAADVSEAARMASAATPDAIVLDVHLDAAAGTAGLARLRRLAPDATIVALTNEASDVHRRECIRYGADFFLDKSYDFDRAVELLVSRHVTPKS